MAASADPGLSLYVHVPFCTDKCLYCDFYSVPRRSVPASTIERVTKEVISLARVLLEASGDARVRTIFIGGGTPSCLPPPLLRELLGAFRGLGADEWTVESNPETLSHAFVDECARAGVTRLSLGIQSLHTELLNVLARRATREQGIAAMRLLRDQWKGEVNLDFITGIPGQTTRQVTGDLDVIDNNWPDHVSLYQLTVEPGTPLEAGAANGSIALNADEVDEELWLAGREALQERGLRQYEVSNFARPGRECRHNLGYWRIDPYAGAGPGAVSTLPSPWASRAFTGMGPPAGGTVTRLSVPRDIALFLQGREKSWGIVKEVISAADFLLEVLMMGLRLADGIPAERLPRLFGQSFDELFPGLWEQWVQEGAAVPPGREPSRTLQLTPAGLMILDHLLGEVIEQLPRQVLDSTAPAWPE